MRFTALSRRPWRAALVASVVALAAAALVWGVTSSGGSGGDEPEHTAKNAIFVMGDGMGASARTLIRLATTGHDGDLAMNRLRYAGLVETDPDDDREVVTDSAAAATAFATGVRTYNGAVGVDVQAQPLPTLLERARAAGKATGLVTTAEVTDASPAAFGAHVEDRAQQSEVARQYLEDSKPDVILGGGEDRWLEPGNPGAYPDHPRKDPAEESSSDRGDLLARAEELGYEYVSDRAGLEESRGPKLLGLFANAEMYEQRPEGEGDLYEPVVPLDEMTEKALSILERDPEGFFLFVEEDGIDEFSHQNNARMTIRSGQALDRAVEVAARYTAGHPDTLLVVGADHATGGLAIENVDPAGESRAGDTAEDGPFTVAGTDEQVLVDWTTDGHTGEAVPVTADGPGAAALARVQKNTDVHDTILRAMGLGGD
jgi:alkaline phosphatase